MSVFYAPNVPVIEDHLVVREEEVSCAICLECIDLSMNVIKTECRHCFHSNCFLQNAAHNGFNCPMCRNELASLPESEEDDDDDDDDDDDSENDDNDNEDFALRGARWLMMRAEGDEIADDDTDDDNTDENSDADVNLEYVRVNEGNAPLLSIAQISEQLVQRGVTFDQLVALLIFPDSRHREDVQRYNTAVLTNIDNIFEQIIFND